MLEKRIELYSDLRTDFAMSPVTFDVMRVTNENSISQSLANLIQTNRGECVTDPNKGCDISRFMFKNITPVNLILMKQDIISTIKTYEKRIELIGVDVISGSDGYEVQVTVFYMINQQPEPISLTVVVKRVR